MKRLLLLACLFSSVLHAQDTETTTNTAHYVFPAFTSGTVVLKNGEKQYYQLNYNTVSHEMIFDKDGTKLAIAKPEDVDTVFIGTRKFIYMNDVFYEVLTNTPVALFAEYKGTLKSQGSDIGYGMGSNLAGNTAVSAVKHSGLLYELNLPQDYSVSVKTDYWLRKEDKFYKANSSKQVAGVFQDKEKQVKELAKKNNTDFSKGEDIATLVKDIQQSNP